MAKKKYITPQVAKSYDDAFEAFNDINNGIKTKGFASLGNEASSKFRGYNTDFGNSKYDENLSWNADIDEDDIKGSINEYRAQNQGWLPKTSSGLGRIVVKAGSEIAKIPGYIGGGIAALNADENEGMETFVNNSWVKAINNFNEEVNSEYLPVYVKKAVSEGNLWDNITSIDFWATDGADGIGFIASMLAPGAALKGLGLGSKLSKLPGLSGRMSSATGDVITATVANTAIESAAEAQGAMSNFDKNKNEFLSEQIKNGLSIEDAENLFKEQKAKLGRDIFISNLAILAVPNAIQSSMLWGKGINKSVSKILDSDGKLLSTVIEPKLYQKVLNRGKNVLGATVSEGFVEEAGQSTVENMFTNSANKGKLTDNVMYDFNLNELGKNYIETISSTDGQKAMFLGAFLGGAMSAISGAKQDIKDRKDTQSLLNIGNNAIDSFYKVFQTDLYKEDGTIDSEKLKSKFEAFGQIEQLNLMYNDAVQKQDKEALEKLRDLAATQLAYGFIMNDELGLDVLKEHLNQSSQFDEIVLREQEAGNKTTKEEIVKNVMEKATVLQKAYSNFNDFAPTLINPTLTESENETDILSFRNKLRSNYLTNKATINLYDKELKKLKEKRANILSDLDLDSNLVIGDETIQKQEEEDSRLKQNKESINEIEISLKRLKKLDNNFWNQSHLQKEFERFTKEKKQLEKETSKEKELKAEEISTQIKEATSVKDLEEIKTDNPIQQKEIEVKKQEFANAEDAVLTEELNNKKAKESLIKNQDLDSLKEMEDTAIDPITGKEGIVMENNENNVVIQTDEGQLIKIKKPKINTENISSNEEVEDVKEENEDLSSKSNFSLPSKFDKTFKSFVDFMMKPFNKKGLKTSFKLNTENAGVNQKNAIQVYNEAINGKSLSLEDKNLLFNWLPLTIEIDGNNSWSGYPGGKGDYSNPEEKFTIRKNIVDAISQGVSLENINGNVAGQSSPELNCEFKDNKPVKNNVLEIDYIKDITNESKDLSKLEIYHVNLEGKLIPVSQGADLNPSAKTKELLSTGVGNIYITIKNPLGSDVPLKLNFSRLGEQLTVSLLDIYKHILTHANEELLYTQSLSDLNNEDSQFYNPILYENLKTKLKGAINLLGNKENEITLEQIIETLILEDSGSNSHLKIVEDEQGQYALEFKEGNRYYLQDLNDSETLSVLTKDIAENKYRNIITIPNEINKTKLSFKNEEYLKYLFDTKALTTNVSTTSYSFKPEEATIWLEPGITTTKQVKSKPQQSDTEAKKVDIERRRQEELNEESYRIPIAKESKTFVDENGTNFKITITTLKNGAKVSQTTNLDNGVVTLRESYPKELDNAKIYNTESAGEIKLEDSQIAKKEALSDSRISNKINAKYDAELAALENETEPEQTNAFGTNPNFKSTKTVIDPETGESFEIEETLEDLQKQLQEQISNRDKAPLQKLKDVFNVKIQEIEEKIRNIQKNSVSLSKDLIMEIEKEGTKENKEVVKAKVENILSKAEQIKEIEQMTQLNNMLLLNPSLPQQIKDKFEELKNKYSDEFNKLPKKCNS